MEYESTSVDFGNYSAVLIPKNANWWLVTCSGNKRKSYIDSNKPGICVLRNPLERWCTGVAQFLSSKNLRREYSEQEILDTLRKGWFLDPHTMPQHWFLRDMDLSNMIWFWLDDNFTKNFYSWCNDLNIPVKHGLDSVHKTQPGSNKYKIKQHYLELSSKVGKVIEKVYADDYKLIQSVNFYEAR